MVAYFSFFFLSQLSGFLIDQMKFFCWAQGTSAMSLRWRYNISDVETALQQPYYRQLWQADYNFFAILFLFTVLLLSEIILVIIIRL